MNSDSPEQSCHQTSSGDIQKKVKKRKRNICDTVCADSEAGEVLYKEKKRSRKMGKLRGEEDNTVLLEDGAEVQVRLGDGTLFKKRKKKKSGKDCIVEGDFVGLVKLQEELPDDAVHCKEKKKRKYVKDLDGEGVSCHVGEVEEDDADLLLVAKKGRKRKSVVNVGLARDTDDVSNIEGDFREYIVPERKRKERKSANEKGGEVDFDGIITEGLEQSKGTLLHKKKATVNDSPVDGFAEETEEFGNQTSTSKKEKMKLVSDKVVEKILDDALPVKDTHKPKGKDFVWHKKRESLVSQIMSMYPQPAQRKKKQPKYKSIVPENVEGWQPMVFKFDNHPEVRHYIPRKLMAMNGVKQQLEEVDEVQLKIPNILFQGSSLPEIPGYGYGPTA